MEVEGSAAPPGVLPMNVSIRRNHLRRDGESPSTDSLIRDARVLLEACGVSRSQKWVSRVAREYAGSHLQGMPFGLFLTAQLELNAVQRRRLAERADLRYLLSYADPTGETAARNVMKERGF